MRRLMLLALLLLGGVVCAYAGPTDFTFLAFNGGDWQNGYPYFISPTDSAGAVIAVMCDDYVHGGQPGDMWQANITQLGTGNIMETRFNRLLAGPSSLSNLTLYDEAGWILLQTQMEPTTDWQSMTYAVWHIFDSRSPCDSACQMWLLLAMQQAEMHFPGSDFNRVYVITPVDQYNPDPNSPQEFLALGPDSGFLGCCNSQSQTVPEPGTLVLLGTGTLALVARKFRNG